MYATYAEYCDHAGDEKYSKLIQDTEGKFQCKERQCDSGKFAATFIENSSMDLYFIKNITYQKLKKYLRNQISMHIDH